jgi:hypothetical protein
VNAGLFDAPVPPANRHEYDTSIGCVYDGLVSLACRKWEWKRTVEKFCDNLLIARTNGKRQQELESIGRDVRHIRAEIAPDHWTVLDEAGRVNLCMTHEADEMLAALKLVPTGMAE